jgi:hypothetical protein
MFACPETIVRPAGHEVSPAAVEAAGSVIAARVVEPWVIDPLSPPPQAARAAAPITTGTKVTFTTKTLLRDRTSSSRAPDKGSNSFLRRVILRKRLEEQSSG